MWAWPPTTIEGDNTLNKTEILEAIAGLARSQGSYGRLYEQIKDNEEALDYLADQKFSDVVDMIMFLEG